jgi:hypothetical protein
MKAIAEIRYITQAVGHEGMSPLTFAIYFFM